MKNSSLKSSLLAAIAIGCAVLTQSAVADQIDGALTIMGGAVFDTANLGSATQVTDFVDAEVQSLDGDFAVFASIGDAVNFVEPWVFNPSTAEPIFYSVSGFTFNLVGSTILFQSDLALVITGTGFVSGNGFDATPGSFNFTTQKPSAAGVFSFSAATDAVPSVPDGGSLLMLLGVAMVGVEAFRRKIKAS